MLCIRPWNSSGSTAQSGNVLAVEERDMAYFPIKCMRPLLCKGTTPVQTTLQLHQLQALGIRVLKGKKQNKTKQEQLDMVTFTQINTAKVLSWVGGVRGPPGRNGGKQREIWAEVRQKR